MMVTTDFEASPTGYPFKVVVDRYDHAELDAARGRERVCDLGYLRQAFRDESGALDFRCPGEPHDAYLRKGGATGETANKLCICNRLLATIGLGQSQAGGPEIPLVTAGTGLPDLPRFVPAGQRAYSVHDVMTELRRAAEARTQARAS